MRRSKYNRGKWTELRLSSVVIANLMGCVPYTAKRYLSALQRRLNIPPREIPPSYIGELISDYRLSRETSSIDKYLRKYMNETTG